MGNVRVKVHPWTIMDHTSTVLKMWWKEETSGHQSCRYAACGCPGMDQNISVKTYQEFWFSTDSAGAHGCLSKSLSSEIVSHVDRWPGQWVPVFWGTFVCFDEHVNYMSSIVVINCGSEEFYILRKSPTQRSKRLVFRLHRFRTQDFPETIASRTAATHLVPTRLRHTRQPGWETWGGDGPDEN